MTVNRSRPPASPMEAILADCTEAGSSC